MSNADNPKINFFLLNKLVNELNDQFKIANNFAKDQKLERLDYITEMSKCLGLASAIVVEASALTMDFSMVSRDMPNQPGVNDMLQSLPDAQSINGLFGSVDRDSKKKN